MNHLNPRTSTTEDGKSMLNVDLRGCHKFYQYFFKKKKRENCEILAVV